MKPKEVPAGFVDLAVEVFEEQAHEHCNEDGCPGSTRTYHEALVREALAEILPEHEKQVREQAAEEARTLCGPGRTDWYKAYNLGVHDAARTVGGAA